MEWDIITGSKGGIGKSLLALLLLVRHLRDKEYSTLVLDLNAANTDFSAVLLYNKKIGDPLTVIPNGGKQLTVQRTFAVEKDKKNKPQRLPYVVAQPTDPFDLYSREQFATLFSNIKELVQTLEKAWKLPPFKHIVVDSNCHFCNMFSQHDVHYGAYQEEGILKDERFSIWFLWVYRQLDKLISPLRTEEARIVKSTAVAMEKNLKSVLRCQDPQNATPFMHVFSPMAVVSSQPESEAGVVSEILKALFVARKENKEHTIKELDNLLDNSPTDCVTFEEWITKLQTARGAMGERFNNDPHLLFIDMLVEALGDSRPLNVIPLSVFDPRLQYYTDQEKEDIVSTLRGFKIYENFSKLVIGDKDDS